MIFFVILVNCIKKKKKYIGFVFLIGLVGNLDWRSVRICIVLK